MSTRKLYDLLLGAVLIGAGGVGLCSMSELRTAGADFGGVVLFTLLWPTLICGGIGALFHRLRWGLIVGLILGVLCWVAFFAALSSIRC